MIVIKTLTLKIKDRYPKIKANIIFQHIYIYKILNINKIIKQEKLIISNIN